METLRYGPTLRHGIQQCNDPLCLNIEARVLTGMGPHHPSTLVIVKSNLLEIKNTSFPTSIPITSQKSAKKLDKFVSNH